MLEVTTLQMKHCAEVGGHELLQRVQGNKHSLAGMHWVSDRLAQRRVIGNAAFAVIGSAGIAATYWAFTDPEQGRYVPDVDFSNWSGTHTVTCKCAPLQQHRAHSLRIQRAAEQLMQHVRTSTQSVLPAQHCVWGSRVRPLPPTPNTQAGSCWSPTLLSGCSHTSPLSANGRQAMPALIALVYAQSRGTHMQARVRAGERGGGGAADAEGHR